MNTASYYDASAAELKRLYDLSSQFLKANQHSLNEEELFGFLEQHFYLSLLTSNDVEAKVTLQRITDRFGEEPSRVGVLKAQYLEATEGIETCQAYLSSRPTTDYLAFKRKTVILKQRKDFKMLVDELLRYLSVIPTDAETWAELAEVYVSCGLYSQAVHALEETVVLMPQAYNMFARMGELLHIEATTSSSVADQLNLLQQSVVHFLRAAELCPNYVRGWTGVNIVAGKLLNWPKLASKEASKYTKLRQISSKELKRIIAEESADPVDLKAAELLVQDIS